MLNTRKSILALAVIAGTFQFVQAQEAPNVSRNENIIIRKKDSTKEKITVVIDGDDIMVNGKPVDDFKSDDVDIVKQNFDYDYDFGLGGAAIAPAAPFAPEADVLRRRMITKVKTNAAFLGVMTEKTTEGAKITEVTEGSAAEKAGLKEGDVITQIDKEKVTGPDDLYKIVGKHKPDDKVAITYLRDGKQSSSNITLGKPEKMRVYSWNAPGNFNNDFNRDFNRSFSFTLNDRPRLGVAVQDTEDENGVKILEVEDEDDSPAAKAGLKEDDVITQVNGKVIKSTDDLKENMKAVKKGDTLKITYKRNNQTQTVDVKLPKDLKTIDL
jgi:serine protease Do